MGQRFLWPRFVCGGSGRRQPEAKRKLGFRCSFSLCGKNREDRGERGEAGRGRKVPLIHPALGLARGSNGSSQEGVGIALGRYSRRGERRPGQIAPSPLDLFLSFYSSPFLISFSVIDLNTAVNELFGGANELQNL